MSGRAWFFAVVLVFVVNLLIAIWQWSRGRL